MNANDSHILFESSEMTQCKCDSVDMNEMRMCELKITGKLYREFCETTYCNAIFKISYELSANVLA